MKLTITTEQRGKKLVHTCTADGEVIGTRTSQTRQYNFALIVKGNKEGKLATIRTNIKHNRKNEAEYREYASCATEDDAVRLAIKKGKIRKRAKDFDIRCVRDFYSEGSYAKWADGLNKELPGYEQEILDIEAGKWDDDFEKLGVYSWHGALRNVPTSAPHSQCQIAGVAKVEVAS